MWNTALKVLGGVSSDPDSMCMAARLATLPLRLGGLGLRSASRTAPAAYWASWADALPMVKARAPGVAADCVAALNTHAQQSGCLAEARDAGELLTRKGFLQRPSWQDLLDGQRPPAVQLAEPGEWKHGWQYIASSTLEHHFRRDAVIAQSSLADRAHLRSHSGRYAGVALSGAPTAPEFTLDALEYRTLLLERLRLPLPLAAASCEGCGGSVDARGRHYASCTASGRVKKRAAAPEQAVARICREAGAAVKCNVFLRDLNVGAAAGDGRRLEVLAQGLPLRGGKQLAVDVTLRSVLAADGTAHSRAAVEDGVVAARARKDKEDTYPELVVARRCTLVVVAIETGGRWADEAADFVGELAYARAREAQPLVRAAAALAWMRRWSRLLGTACARAFAQSLVAPATAATTASHDGSAPPLSVLLDGRG